MTAKTRIYLIRDANTDDSVALVRAATRGQALAQYARRSFVAGLASQDELLSAYDDGLRVEDAADDGLEEAA